MYSSKEDREQLLKAAEHHNLAILREPALKLAFIQKGQDPIPLGDKIKQLIGPKTT